MARELSDGGGWHFTVKNDDRIWTHECCRDPGPPATEEDAERYGYTVGEPTLGKPHAPHATQEEAEACLQEWRLRQAADWDESAWSNWQGCEAPVDPPDAETAARIAACETPAFHETHRYCPSCPWTETQRCDQPTKKAACFRDVGGPVHVSLCDQHLTTETVVAYAAAHRVTAATYS
jgi:hypothetical protein